MNRVTSPPGFAPPAFVIEARCAFEALRAQQPDVAFVDAVLVDINGILRGKRLPVADAGRLFACGMQIPHSVYLMDPLGEMTNPFGRGVGNGDPDGTAWPIPSTVGLVWTGEVPRIRMLMTLFDEQGAVDVAEPRAALTRVLECFSDSGLAPVVAVELEFNLIDRARSANRSPQPPVDVRTGQREFAHAVYETDALDRYAGFFSALEDAASLEGVPLSAASKEYGPGQFEANLRHCSDALLAADHAVRLKEIVRSAARSRNVEATFMAKPYRDRAGNGMHIHVSLLNKAGRNIFDDGTGSGSDALRYAAGGLRALMAESMAVFAPSVNSYRRLAPDMFAPVNRQWGHNNRSVSIRVPQGPPEARRIEHRAAGADANPYLATAVVLAGIHYGLEKEIDPGPEASGNVSREPDPALPLTIDAALAKLGEAKVLPKYLGEETLRLFRESKRLELERFRRTVPPHEYDWYL